MSNRHKTTLLTLVMLLFWSWATAQIYNPVKWRCRMEMTDDTHGAIIMAGRIESGWHVYGMDVNPSLGPTPLSVTFTGSEGVKFDGPVTPSKAATAHFDNNFNAEVTWWEKSVTLRQEFTATAPEFKVTGTIRFAACNDTQCTPPSKETFEFKGTAPVAVPAKQTKPETAEDEAKDATKAASADTSNVLASTDTTTVAPIVTDSLATAATDSLSTWAPVEFNASNNPATMSVSGLWTIFLMCFLGGLLALFTPCVWPMIPLTVSFFLKKGKSKSSAVADALTYGLSIVVIYVVLGMAISMIFGADALNALATSATCNIIFFLLLVVFAVSFFGAFDIRLPEKWGTSMDSKAEKTSGLLSIFFMAFTLALVSFSCTGPIIGTLLVEAATTGSKFGPALGMLGFSLALAIPFCLFAMFPGWLKKAPRSGGWMNTVKVVLGFIELALSLKFLSVADLAYGWHILDRETFLALWIAIFGLLGLYLLGKFNFKHYGEADSSIGTVRFFLALTSLAFTIYLIPGLWGAPLKSVSAFVPPLWTQDLNLYGGAVAEYNDYDEAMAAARKQGKPVFVDFSGYGCVNCRKMEAAVLDRESVHAMMTDNFVVVTLMTDDRTPLSAPERVTENGREILLETVGEKWSYLQRVKFGTNAQPYYVILDADGRLLSGPYAYDENVARFTRFLEDGIRNAAR